LKFCSWCNLYCTWFFYLFIFFKDFRNGQTDLCQSWYLGRVAYWSNQRGHDL